MRRVTQVDRNSSRDSITRSARPRQHGHQQGGLRQGGLRQGGLRQGGLRQGGLRQAGLRQASPRGTGVPRRAGMIVPLVLLSGMILASMVISMQFMSSSDYKRVARMMRDSQAVAIADLASDEMHVALGDIVLGANNSQRPDWLKELLAALEAGINGIGTGTSPDKITVDVKIKRENMPTPISDALALKAGNLVKVESITGRAGPDFTIIRGSLTANDYYHEKAYSDDPSKMSPWDLRGDLNVVITVAGDKGPFSFSQEYVRGQQLTLTDTSPPAENFTLMSFMPPPSQKYATTDMGSPGKLILASAGGTAASRVMLQGPLFTLVEGPDSGGGNTAGKPYLSKSEKAPLASPSYPDTNWTQGFATVPGPDSLQHIVPGSSNTGLQNLKQALDELNDEADPSPRRANRPSSQSIFETLEKIIDIEIPSPFNSRNLTVAEIRYAIELIPDLVQYAPNFREVLNQVVGVLVSEIGGAIASAWNAVTGALSSAWNWVTGNSNPTEAEVDQAEANHQEDLENFCTAPLKLKIAVPKIARRVWNDISVVLRHEIASSGSVFLTNDLSAASFYPPSAYFYATQPKDSQTFEVKGAWAGVATASTAYPGLIVNKDATDVKVPTQIGVGAVEGDAHVLEPVRRSSEYSGWESRGLFGVYGVARFESRSLVNVKVGELMRYLVNRFVEDEWPLKDKRVPICQVNGAYVDFKTVANMVMDDAIEDALVSLGVDKDVDFLIRQYEHEAGETFTGGLSDSTLTSGVQAHKVAVVPFGSYYKDAGFWTSGPGSSRADQLKDGLLKANVVTDAQNSRSGAVSSADDIKAALNELMPRTGDPTVSSSRFPEIADDQKEGVLTRAWLCDEYAAKTFLKESARKESAAASPDTMADAVKVLLDSVDPNNPEAIPSLVSPIDKSTDKRPKGAFGPYRGGGAPTGTPQGLPAALAKIRTNFEKRGFFPPKWREYDKIATRSFGTMGEYIASDFKNGKLELRGAVLVRKADPASWGSLNQAITYTGRGILIVLTEKADEVATFAQNITAGDKQKDMLTLVHRIDPQLLADGTLDKVALKLPAVFEGSVYSDSGVSPAGNATTITGNLVTGLLNKTGIGTGKTLEVHYDAAFLEAATLPQKERWSVEMVGEVTSVEPTL